jgi:hypothetical protein
MDGVKTKKLGKETVQLSVTVYPEHIHLIEKILEGSEKPIVHKSTSEIVRRAIEYYAEFLGINFEA